MVRVVVRVVRRGSSVVDVLEVALFVSCLIPLLLVGSGRFAGRSMDGLGGRIGMVDLEWRRAGCLLGEES